MSWYKYNNFQWRNLVLLSLAISLLMVAFFRNSKTQIESVTLPNQLKSINQSHDSKYEIRLKLKMKNMVEKLNSKAPAQSLDYTFDKSAYWIIARKGKIVYQKGKAPSVNLTHGWQKHFMLGAYMGKTNPGVFESKCLKLIQQPISYEEFISQQLRLHSIQIGFNNIAYCYIEKNSYSILVVLDPNPLALKKHDLIKLPLSNPTVDFSLQALLISLFIFGLLMYFLALKLNNLGKKIEDKKNLNLNMKLKSERGLAIKEKKERKRLARENFKQDKTLLIESHKEEIQAIRENMRSEFEAAKSKEEKKKIRMTLRLLIK